jgi:hypothetical protein
LERACSICVALAPRYILSRSLPEREREVQRQFSSRRMDQLGEVADQNEHSGSHPPLTIVEQDASSIQDAQSSP